MCLNFHIFLFVDASCEVPYHIQGDYFSMEFGADVNTLINEVRLTTEEFEGTCHSRKDYNHTIDANGAFDTDIIFYSRCE